MVTVRPFKELVSRAEADPAILGLVLSGSHARGMATAHSDFDVYVMVRDRGGQWTRFRRAPELDEIFCTLAELADINRAGHRYAFRGARCGIAWAAGSANWLRRRQRLPRRRRLPGPGATGRLRQPYLPGRENPS
jgi:predicted nucleotidyltransferase